MKFRKKKKLAQERAIRDLVRSEMDRFIQALEERAEKVELPEEAMEYCKKKDEEFLSGLARLETQAPNASIDGGRAKGEMIRE